MRATLCLLLLAVPLHAAEGPEPAAPAKRAASGHRIDPGPPQVYRNESRGLAFTLGTAARAKLGLPGFLLRTTDAEGLVVAIADATGTDAGVEGLERWVEKNVPSTVPWVQPGGRRDVHSFLSVREDGTVLVGTAARIATGKGEVIVLFELPETDSGLGDARLSQIERSMAADPRATPPPLGSIASLKAAPPPPTATPEPPVAAASSAAPPAPSPTAATSNAATEVAATPAPATANAATRRATVDPLHLVGATPGSATLYEALPPEGRPLREVLAGSELSVLSASSGFLQVRLEDGTEGYIDHTDVAVEPAP